MSERSPGNVDEPRRVSREGAWRVYQLASFVVRNPCEQIVGLYGAEEELYGTYKRLLQQGALDLTYPSPESTALFQEAVNARLPEWETYPDGPEELHT